MHAITKTLTCATLMACVFTAAYAQQNARLPGNFPNKPVRVLVGAAPGGGTDLVARMLVHKLSERWNANVVVDNRSGGAGIVSMNTLAQATPDGYTVIISGNSFIMIGAQHAVSYDIRTTFDAVVQLTSQPYLVVVNATIPVNSVQELIAYAKSKPGALNYGSSGTGGLSHLSGSLQAWISGAHLERASLHNISNVKLLGVSEGDEILVSRRNDVIPQVEEVVVKHGPPAVIPTTCGVCQSTLVTEGEFISCRNTQCRAVVEGRLKNWVAAQDVHDFGGHLIGELVKSKLAVEPSDLYKLKVEDVAALEGFLATLQPPPSPFREADGGLSPAASRGRELFASDRAGCANCHAGRHFTSPELYDVGLSRRDDRYPGFSPPPLAGGFRKTMFLHHGKAKSLPELLTGLHGPDKVSGLPPLSSQEVDDLVAYLKSL